MSSIYSLEPFPTAKVILHTSRGPIEVELWAKEAPKASRNFIQLCLEGYYDNTIFHRVVPGFIIQGGDPTGTGRGGESIWDEPFEDEFHSRLRFTRRGLLAMANTGPNENMSQFFFTLDQTPELQNKNTLFGRVEGNTIYNLLSMAEVETGEDDRPSYPPKIVSVQVVEHPFQDLKPRSTAEERTQKIKEAEAAEARRVQQERAKKAKKNRTMLSFGDDEEGSEAPSVPRKKVKSSHDLGKDPLLSQESVAVRQPKQKADDAKPKVEPRPTDTEPLSEKRHPSGAQDKVDTRRETNAKDATAPVSDKAKKQPSSIHDQIAQLKNELKTSRTDNKEDKERAEKAEAKLNFLQAERQRYMANDRAIVGGRKKALKKGNNEAETMAKLASFQQKIALPVDDSDEQDEGQGVECELHGVPGCYSCYDRLGETNEQDEDDPNSWLGHSLRFAHDRMGKDQTFKLQKAQEDFDVIDPKEREGQIKLAERERRRHKETPKAFRPGHR